jgi:hypothetical protein
MVLEGVHTEPSQRDLRMVRTFYSIVWDTNDNVMVLFSPNICLYQL